MITKYQAICKQSTLQKLKALSKEAMGESQEAITHWAEAAKLEQLAQEELPPEQQRWGEHIGCLLASKQTEAAQARLVSLPTEEQERLRSLLAQKGIDL